MSEGNYPGRDECRAGAKKTTGDCSVGLQQGFRQENLHLDEQNHVLGDVYGASHVYDDMHKKGDARGDVTQVPHAHLMTDVFGAEGNVSGLLQFFSKMQMDHIQYIRQVFARLQNTSLDDKTIG